ncbi:MAG: FMN-binding protein [Gemmatimonadota bacterium]
MDLLSPLRAAAARGLLLGALAALALPGAAAAQLFMSQEEALRLAFPAPATIERKTAYLTDAELARARELAGDRVEVEQGIVTHYVGRRGGAAVGVAYFDAHRVRTLPEVLMIVVGPDGRVQRVEVIKFTEPPDYVAPDGWLAQFLDRRLDGRLSTKADIVNMTGATLTSRAVTDAVRRVLALHQVIGPLEDRGR